jgi:phosphoketolase
MSIDEVQTCTLSPKQLREIDNYLMAANDLAVGQLSACNIPLLRLTMKQDKSNNGCSAIGERHQAKISWL